MMIAAIKWLILPILLLFIFIATSFGSNIQREDILSRLASNTLPECALSLPQAIHMVFLETHGTLLNAKLVFEDMNLHYEIEIIAGQQVYVYKVDPVNGAIVDRQLDVFDMLENFFRWDNDEETVFERQHLVLKSIEKVKEQIISIEIDEDSQGDIYKLRSYDKNKLTEAIVNIQNKEILFYRNYPQKF